jgi:hypothetical protein
LSPLCLLFISASEKFFVVKVLFRNYIYLNKKRGKSQVPPLFLENAI